MNDEDARAEGGEMSPGREVEDLLPAGVPAFAALQPGQRAGLVVYADQRTARLTATVAAVGRDIVQLALSPLDRGTTLTVGAMAQLQTATRRGELMQVLATQPAFEPVVVLRSFAPTAHELRQARRKVLMRPPTVLASMLAGGRVRAARVMVLDLSALGAGVLTAAPMAVGDRLRLRLDRAPAPGQEQLAWDAVVIWVEAIGTFWRAGTQFESLSAAQLAWLVRTMDEAETDWQAFMERTQAGA